ncbi:MAG: glycosyltransferase family 4 protein, partial [Desulfovibrio sp.]|nr:glycosyltransferase family 4 protein [Desulfovibrio sp.]
ADAKRIADLAGPEAGARTRLVYNSLTLHVDELAPLAFAKPCRILAVGRFDVTKGFDVLMQACGLLKRQGRDFRLTLAGGGGRAMGLGAMTETILGLRKSLGLEAVVDLPGIVGHDRLPAIIKAHDIFTAPCVVHESGRRDGIPNTIIEAMSFGLPVVATSTNALPEAVHDGETGLLVEQKDPKALADALAWLMDHPDEARAMGRAGARLAREMFSPEENGDRLAQLFIDALSGAPSPSSDSRGGACAE